jgi:predicted amidohydrolase YtcJ
MSGADTIFCNGRVLTGNDKNLIADAVAIRGGRILAVGSDTDIAAFRTSSTKVISLDGRSLIPGIVDAHAHLEREGLKTLRPSLAHARCVADILDVVRAQARKLPTGTWIVTMPIGAPPFYFKALDTLAEKRLPTRAELDEAAPDHPVCIGGLFGNWGRPPSYIALNTCALARTGILAGRKPECAGVEIQYTETGEPNGWIIEHNRRLTVDFDLLRNIPGFDFAQRLEGLRRSIKLYHSVGTTAVYEGHGSAAETIAVYRSLAESGELSMRSFLCVSPSWADVSEARRAMRDWLGYARGAGLGDDWLRVAGIFVGIEGDPTVARLCREALPNTGWTGFVEWHNRLDDFREIAFLAAENDLRLNTIVKDRLPEILTIFEEVDRRYGISRKNWVIEHIGLINDADFARIKALGLVVTVIPVYMLWKNGEVYRPKIGDGDNFVPLRSLLEQGIPIGAGTDNIPYNPFFTMWAMRKRQERVSGDILGLGQQLTAQQALRVMTLEGARVALSEHQLGTIAIGKKADLAVLSVDPIACDLETLATITAELTMTDGVVRHDSGALAL